MASLSRSSVAASTLDFLPKPKDNTLRRRLTGLATNAPENNNLREKGTLIVFTQFWQCCKNWGMRVSRRDLTVMRRGPYGSREFDVAILGHCSCVRALRGTCRDYANRLIRSQVPSWEHPYSRSKLCEFFEQSPIRNRTQVQTFG